MKIQMLKVNEQEEFLKVAKEKNHHTRDSGKMHSRLLSRVNAFTMGHTQ